MDVAITPDKKYALVSESLPMTLRRIDISDPANPVQAGTLNIGMWANDIAISPDGKMAVISDSAYISNTTIAFVDLVNFKLNGVYTLTTPGGSAQAVAIAPDNKTVIIADANNGRIISGAIRADGTGLTSENVYPAPLSPRNVAISPDGSTVLAVSYGGQSLYAYQITATGVLTPTATVTGLPTGGQSVAFAPDGKTAYTVHDGTSPKMVVLNVADPSQISVTAVLPLPVAPSGYYGTDTLAVSSDGKYAVVTDAALSAAPTLAVIDLTTFAVSSVILAADEPRGVAFIPQIPPTITGDPATTGLVGDGYSFTPGSTGATSFDIENAPSWASFDKATGALTGVPDAKGTFSGIVITAKNEDGSTPLPVFDITVPNRPPVLSGTAPASAAAAEPYTFTPTASDPDGDALTFSITGKPAWASFDSSTGTLSGIPDATQVASFDNIVISVSDGQASTALPAFAINVTPGVITCGTPASITVPLTNSTGKFTVQWGASATPGVTYVLEQESGNGFTTAYSGTATSFSVNATHDGKYTFRVKAVKTDFKDSAYKEGSCVVTLVCGTPSQIAVPANNNTGSVYVSWGTSDVVGVTYVLEQKLGDGSFTEAYRGTSTYTTVKISQGGSYSFQVKAIKTGYGDSGYRTAANACLVNLACAMPAYLNVPASTNTGSALVTWGTSDVSGVTYVLERKLENGTFAQLYSGAATSATVNFTQSGTYSFQVKAVKSGYSESAYRAASNTCSVNLTCGVPASLTVPASSSTGNITVSWGASNLAGVTYVLEQRIGSGDYVGIYSGTGAFSRTLKVATNGVYSYRIKATKTGFADSGYLEAGNSCTVQLACGAPAYLSVPTSNSTGSVALSWGPSDVTGVTYVLEQKLGDGSFVQVYSGSYTSVNISVPGNGTYTFQVKAMKSGYADSGYSAGASTCTVNLVCGAPSSLTVPPSDSTGSIRIAWGPSDVAGATYVLEQKLGEGQFTQIYSGNSTYTTVKISQNGTYTFQLKATKSGYLDSGYKTGTCVVSLVCGTPAQITVPSSNSNGLVYVSWGASDVAGVTYVLEQKLGAGSFTEAYRGSSTYTTLKISQSGSYTFQVKAIKTGYDDSGYQAAPTPCVVNLACGAPAYLHVPASTNTGSALVTWGTSDVSGVSYVLERKLENGSFAQVYYGSSTYATVSFTQSGSYSFQVKAVKTGYNESAYTAASNSCSVDLTCGVPASLTVPASNTTGSITVSWGASNLAGVTYVLEQSIGSGAFVPIYSGTGAFSTTLKVANNSVYSYRIKATKTGFADSGYLEAGNSCTVQLACGAPAYLTVPSSNSTGSVALSWGPSDLTGVTYVVEQKLGSGSFVPVYSGPYTSVSLNVPLGGTYTFQVKATKSGYTDSGYRASTCTVNLACGIPSSLTVPASDSTGSIRISWGPSDVAGATYVLEQKLGEGQFTQIYSGTSTYTTVKISQSGTYTFQLKATKSGYLDSGYKGATCVVKLVCGTPPQVAVPSSNSNGLVYVSWGASDVAGVSYVLEQKLGAGSFTEVYRGYSTYTTVKIGQSGSYTFQVKAVKTGYDDSGYRTAPNACLVNLACGTPGYLNVPASGNTGSALVTWGRSDVSGVSYVLERKLGDGSFTQVYSGAATSATVSFTQSGSYTFQVKAVKTGYSESAYRVAATTCSVNLTCGVPSSLTVPVSNTTGSITVSWGPSNLTGVTYVLEQRIGSGDFVRVYSGTAAFSTTVNVTQNGIYSFRIKAVKAGFSDSGYRAGGNTCSVQLTCGAPSSLTVPASNSTGSFVVSWGSSDVNGVTYVLEQSANGGAYQEIYRGVLHSTTVNVNATGSYSYRVKAIKSGYGSVYRYGPNPCVVS